jgi:hypothetical protein
MSATICPRCKVVTLMRPHCPGVSSMVSRAVKRLAFDSRENWRFPHAHPRIGVAGTGGEGVFGNAAVHRMSLSISSISRAAGRSSSIWPTSRCVRRGQAGGLTDRRREHDGS